MTPALLHPALLFGGGFGGLPPKGSFSQLFACVRVGRRSAPLTPSTGGQNGSPGRRIWFPCSVVPAETAGPPARRVSRATGTHLLRRFSVIPPLRGGIRSVAKDDGVIRRSRPSETLAIQAAQACAQSSAIPNRSDLHAFTGRKGGHLSAAKMHARTDGAG